MFGYLARPGLAVLRILILTGALVSIVQPRVPYRVTELSLVSCPRFNVNAAKLDERSLVRLALTALGLALL